MLSFPTLLGIGPDSGAGGLPSAAAPSLLAVERPLFSQQAGRAQPDEDPDDHGSRRQVEPA